MQDIFIDNISIANKKGNLDAIKQIKNIVSEHKYDIVHCHSPIISKETFYKAQECIAKQKQKEFIKGKGDLLTGKVKCGNCHLAMCYKGSYERYLFCQHATISGSACTCLKKDYQAKMIEGYVKYALRNQLNLLLDLGNQLQTKVETHKSEVKEKKKEIEQRLEYLKAEKIRQYEAFASGNTESRGLKNPVKSRFFRPPFLCPLLTCGTFAVHYGYNLRNNTEDRA